MLDTSIPQKEMEKLLYLCTKHVHFSHGRGIYIQVDEEAMESPIGPVLANIFMTELEIVMIPSLVNDLQNSKRFVDDTFTFLLPVKIGYIAIQLNSFDENIQFAFDVMVIRNINETTNTTVYRKPTNTDIYIDWHSHSPLQRKKTTANMLIRSAVRICFDKKLQNEELDLIKQNLCVVINCPRKSVQNIINYSLHIKRNNSPKFK